MNGIFVARRGMAKLTDSVKAAHAAVAAQRQQPPAAQREQRETAVAHSKSKHQPTSRQDFKVTRLPNDMLVATEDHGSPLARINLAVKAGARYEPTELPGLSHVLRNAAPLATRECTAFGLSRNLEQLGASLKATTTRDLTIYSLECSRDNLQDAMKFLSYVVSHQEFKAWEVLDARERMLVDLAILKKHPEIRLVENLHKAAYRAGLANSLYAPAFSVKNITGTMLSDYAQRTFQPDRVAMTGVNVTQEELLVYAQKLFKFDEVGQQVQGMMLTSKLPEVQDLVPYKVDASNINDRPSRYMGGEHFEDSVDYLAYAAFVTEGPGLNKPKELLAMKLVQNVIGTESTIKWSDGEHTSALTRAAGQVAQNPFAVSGVSFCHSDSSLFGFSVVSHASDLPAILKAGRAVLEGKSGVDQKRLQAAKTRLISCILMAHESAAESVTDAAVQLLASGDLLSANDACGIVEKLTMDDIVGVAKRALKGKPTLAAVGNLSHCPRLDELS